MRDEYVADVDFLRKERDATSWGPDRVLDLRWRSFVVWREPSPGAQTISSTAVAPVQERTALDRIT
jgi:hypothetical protein